jgi:WD40 repeat protein
MPFDLRRLAPLGPSVPALEGMSVFTPVGAAQFAASDDGTLFYIPGKGQETKAPIEWLNSAGTKPLRATAADWTNIRFSPDGRRLAFDIRDAGQSDVFVYDWATDALSRLTNDPSKDAYPIWTPDGSRITFASTRGDKATANLYWQRTDGTGAPARLTESDAPQYPGSWHPGGRYLAFHQQSPEAALALMLLPMEGDEVSGWKPGKPTAFLNGPGMEGWPAFSPDGRWLAYSSSESGRLEVYVTAFPGPGLKWQISTGGGVHATWSRSRNEIFYLDGAGKIMSVPYTVDGNMIRPEKPKLWSAETVFARSSRDLDLHPDGQRFAIRKALESEIGGVPDKVVFIFNFFDELRRIAPAGGR